MGSFRKRGGKTAAWVASAWLLCQTLAFGAPLAAAAIAAAQDLCTCPGGTPGAVCPMHHRVMPSPASPSGPAVRNGCAQPDVTLLSLATAGIGVLPRTALPSA